MKSQTIRISSNCIIMLVDLARTFADPTYQRELDKRHLADISGVKFKKKYVRMPLLSKRKGCRELAIINGQHTIHALLANGVTHYYCQVYTGMTVPEEADMFHATNSRFKSMRGWANFKAALAAGHTVETSIKTIVEDAGLKLAMQGEPHADFNTPQVLRGIYNKRKELLFRRLIVTLKMCFTQGRRDPHLREDAKRNEFQRGLAQFLTAQPLVTAQQLKNAMACKGETAESIYSDAIERAGSCRRTRSIECFLVQVLTELMGLEVNPAIRKRAA